ncbi:MAG: hypothetical protein ABIT38_24665 [Gemmatimonadaceae bacterium]
MSVSSAICVALAALCTALVPALVATNRRLRGPDAGGAGIQNFFLCVPRWIAIAVAMNLLISRGAFATLAHSTATQRTLLMLVHVTAGVLSIAALLSSRSGGSLVQWGVRLFGVGVPVVVIAFLSALSARDVGAGAPEWGAPIWYVIAAVVVIGVVGAYFAVQQDENERVAAIIGARPKAAPGGQRKRREKRA